MRIFWKNIDKCFKNEYNQNKLNQVMALLQCLPSLRMRVLIFLAPFLLMIKLRNEDVRIITVLFRSYVLKKSQIKKNLILQQNIFRSFFVSCI